MEIYQVQNLTFGYYPYEQDTGERADRAVEILHGLTFSIHEGSFVLLCGATADKIEQAIKAAPDYREGKPVLVRFDNLDDTVAYARKIARPGDLVLLSPACASFDQFPNFAARGRYFKEIVNQL